MQVAAGSSNLACHPADARVRHNPSNNNVAFIQNTNLTPKSLAGLCAGKIVAVCPNRTDHWQLGITEAITACTKTFGDTHELFEWNEHEGRLPHCQWTGDVEVQPDGSCCPKFFMKKEVNEILRHLELRSLDCSKKKSFDIVLLNQFSGHLPVGSTKARKLANQIDQCLQCSPAGGDKFPIPLPKTSRPPHLILEEFSPVTESGAGHKAIIEEKKNPNPKWRRDLIMQAKGVGEESTAQINSLPTKRLSNEALPAAARATKPTTHH